MAEEPRPEGHTQADTSDARPVYEVGFHLMPSIAEEEVSAVAEKIHKLLGDAEIISQGAPQKISLAYTIERADHGTREKFSSAYFGWVKCAMGREEAHALAARLRSERQVIRFLIIETSREEEQRSARAVFSSDRLEGQTLEKRTEAEKGGAVSDEELDKSIEALTG